MTAPVRRVRNVFRGQQSDSLRRSLVAGTSGTLLLNVTSLAWNFLAIVALTHALGVRGYGGYAYALAWATLLGSLPLLGFPQLLVREIAAYSAAGQDGLAHGVVAWAYRRVLLLAAVTVGGAAVIGTILIGREQPAVQRAFLIALLLIPVVALYRLAEVVMRGLRHVVEGRLAETTVQPLAVIALVLAVRTASGRHLGAGVAMALTVAAAAAAAVVAHLLLRRTPFGELRAVDPQYDAPAWYRSLRPLSLLSVAQTFHMQIGLVMVGALSSVEDSGLLTTAVRWSSFVALLQVVVNFPLAPAAARLHAQGDRKRLQRLVSTSARVVTAAAVPIALGLVIFDDQALAVFGEPYRAAATALAILVAGELVGVACGSAAVTLTMTNQERVVATIFSAAVVVNVVLNFALIPHFGINGAAAARALTVAVMNIALLGALWRREAVFSGVVGRGILSRRARAIT